MTPSIRLLHLEDDEDYQRLLELALRAHTHAISLERFTRADEALAHLRRLPPDAHPDLLVVDLNLPGMSGYEFIEALDREGPRGLTAVVFTSSASAEDEAFCARHGIDMLTKPASIRDWEELVGWMLATKLELR
ncbi:MAG: response regulator [Chitinophagaceae bacterium]|nr:MAG: response regulator [Chitinophagaceae bacterium]